MGGPIFFNNNIILPLEVCLMSQSWGNVASMHDHLLTVYTCLVSNPDPRASDAIHPALQKKEGSGFETNTCSQNIET